MPAFNYILVFTLTSSFGLLLPLQAGADVMLTLFYEPLR